MNDDERRAALARLGYGECWWRHGLVDEALLAEQLTGLDAADADPGVEHYRWGVFTRHLDARSSVTDADLDGLIEVAQSELGTVLRGSPFIELLHWAALTEPQRVRVAASWDDPGFRRQAESLRVRHALSVERPAGSVITDALASGDKHVHRLLLDRRLLDDVGLRELAEHGAIRAIRNVASAALKRRR